MRKQGSDSLDLAGGTGTCKIVGPTLDVEVSLVQAAAMEMSRRGYAVIPLVPGEKRPRVGDWTNFRIGDQDIVEVFEPNDNLGLVLGAASNGLVDIDLDCPEAVALAELLPPTDMIHGRPSSPASHYWYQVEGECSYEKITDPGATGGQRSVICEIRGTGNHQTMIPPSVHPSGERLSWIRDGDPGKVDSEQLWFTVRRVGAGSLLVRYYPEEGGRHEFCLALAGAILRAGFSRDDAEKFIRLIAQAAHDEEVEDRVRTVETSLQKLEVGERVMGFPSLLDLLPARVGQCVGELLGIRTERGPDQRRERATFAPTELGNMERFLYHNRGKVRYTATEGCWYIWDGIRWARDCTNAIELKAKEAIRKIRDEAEAVERLGPTQHLRHALNSEKMVQVTNILKLARSEPDVATREDEWDRDPWLFNTLNGTLDLRQGILRPADQEDLIRKVAPVTYTRGARSEDWDRFLAETFRGDLELMRYVQKVVGYALTGDTSEEKMFVLWGPTATGKSTFLEALASVLGDYAAKVDFDAFLKSSNRDHQNNLAQLVAVRFGFGSELERGVELREGLVKQLTGGDTITARFLYHEPFSYKPEFKLFIATNYLPQVPKDDDALWRRIIIIPFTNQVRVRRRDPQLKQRLCDRERSGPGILAWAVEGAALWQVEGLDDLPGAVELAIERARGVADPSARFLEEHCVLACEERTKTSALHDAYRDWLQANGLPTYRHREHLAEYLRKKGVELIKSNHTYYCGVRLKT